MANQIKGLQPSRRGPAGTVYHWKPSPRERREGWTNLDLGRDWAAALLAAEARNREVERVRVGAPAGAGAARTAPARMRWRDLVRAYLADPAFTDLKPKSRAEYRSRIGTLTAWAMDGDLALGDLDRQMVLDLRNALVADGRRHRTAALLRVLRVLLNFAAGRGWCAEGLAAAIDIPEAPSRRTVMTIDQVDRLADADRELDLLVTLGFWTFQREGDLLALSDSPFCWRAMDDMSAFARRTLAGPDGIVKGFRLQQGKTGAWVDLPLPHALAQRVDARFAALAAGEGPHRLLFPRPGTGGPWPEWALQRRFKAAREGAGLPHVQFRDLRRSGMVFFGGLNVEIQFITAMSGHAVLGNKRTILDVYMPGNSRFAAEGMALAWSRWQERQAAENGEQEEAK